MDSLTVDRVVSVFQSEYKTTPTTDVFNETYDHLCQVRVSRLPGKEGAEFSCELFAFVSQSSLEFFEAKGFGSLPQVLVNGAQISMDTVSRLMVKKMRPFFKHFPSLFSSPFLLS